MSSGIPPKDIKNNINLSQASSAKWSVSPETLIKKYFQQLTSGCGRTTCKNKQCVSGGRSALSCDEAAAVALRLLLEKAQICTDQMDIQPMNQPTVATCVLDAEPLLNLTYIQNLIDSCHKEFNDFKPLVRVLGKVFSTPELINRSFALKREAEENSAESIIPIDHNEVIESYNLLFKLGDESVENAIINGINALGNSVEIQLRSTNTVLEKQDLNQFVIVLLNPDLHSPQYLESALPNILRALTALSVELQYILVQYWSKFPPEELKRFLEVFQQMITVRILTGPHATTSLPVNDDHPITNSVKCMKLIYYASILGGEFEREVTFNDEYDDNNEPMNISPSNNLLADAIAMQESEDTEKDELFEKLGIDITKCRKPLIPHSNFINEVLNDAVEMDRDFMYHKESGTRFSFLKYPFALSTATKSLGLFFDNRVRMYSERRMTILYGLVQGQIPSPYLKLRVRRDHLIQDALVRLEMIAQDQPEDFKKQFYVEFDGEQGIDEGGVSKEFFQLVIEELFNPDFGMFEFNKENRTCWFKPGSFETENQFTLIGLLFGIAIYNNVILDVHFPPVLYRKLMGMKGKLEDLETSHPGIHKSLMNLLNYDGDVSTDIMATFEISYEVFESTVNHELVPDGKNRTVTNDNRQEYADRYADFLLNTSGKRQFEAFKRGFDIVTNDSLLKTLFRADELEMLVCGSQVFELSELESTTEYDAGYTKDTPVIRNFWEIVHSMTREEVKQLLNFTTGSDRVPVGGLAKLKLIIARNGEDSDRLPTAHTCFNVLLLPEYSTLEKLRNRLLKAISNAKGFGLM